MKVIFVRHAETEWNSKGIIQGHNDSALTPRGLRETAALLAALATADYRIECVYASPLGRAWQMGQSLAECFRCALLAEPALKEQAFGQFEGMSAAWLRQHHPDDANALFTLDAAYCPPGGESLAQACQRLLEFLYRLEETSQHQTIGMVSHGHVSQGVIAILKEGAVENYPRYAQPNASYSVFELINGQCTDLKWGIATHLGQLDR